MGVLTDDMTRLNGEINAARKGRGTLRGNLAQMKRNLTRQMKALQKSVRETQSRLRKAHREMADSTAAERAAFVADLTGTVTGLCGQVAADLAGAHRAFFGRSPTQRTPRQGARPAGRKTRRSTARAK
jgi:chromosome segregation ATPase